MSTADVVDGEGEDTGQGPQPDGGEEEWREDPERAVAQGACLSQADVTLDVSTHIDTAVGLHDFARHHPGRIRTKEEYNVCDVLWLCHLSGRHQGGQKTEFIL